jgi:hypothetical protein
MMKVLCFIPVSLPILLASLVGCGSQADAERERRGHSATEKNRLESANTSLSTDPLSKQVGDELATDFRNAANDVERAVADARKREREFDDKAKDLAALQESGKNLAKTGGVQPEWISLMKAIDKAVASVHGDPDKPLLVVERLSSERLEDLSDWFGSLPKSAAAKLTEEDRRTPPVGAGWLWTLELRLHAVTESDSETILKKLAEALRESRLPDRVRLTHPVLKRSSGKAVITFVVRHT